MPSLPLQCTPLLALGSNKASPFHSGVVSVQMRTSTSLQEWLCYGLISLYKVLAVCKVFLVDTAFRTVSSGQNT